MSLPRRRTPRLLPLSTALVLTACTTRRQPSPAPSASARTTPVTPASPAEPELILTTAGAQRVALGAVVPLHLFTRATGVPVAHDATAEAAWSVVPPEAGTIDAARVFHAARAGHAAIVADLHGRRAESPLEIAASLPAPRLPQIDVANGPAVRAGSLSALSDGRVRLTVQTVDYTLVATARRRDTQLPMVLATLPEVTIAPRAGADDPHATGEIAIDAVQDGLARGHATLARYGAPVQIAFVLPLEHAEMLTTHVDPPPAALVARRADITMAAGERGVDVTLHVEGEARASTGWRFVRVAVGLPEPGETRALDWRAMGSLGERPAAPLPVHRPDSEAEYPVTFARAVRFHGWDLVGHATAPSADGSRTPYVLDVSYRVPAASARALAVALQRASLGALGVDARTEVALRVPQCSRETAQRAAGTPGARAWLADCSSSAQAWSVTFRPPRS